jgi:hypothetical protein
MWRCTWHWPVLMVSDRFITEPIGNLATKPP